jgi:predicted GNAT family acetyltransferase
LRADAFEGQADPTPDQMRTRLTFYNHTHRSPLYHAPTDLCVLAPDGRCVAGAEALIDAHNAEADVERVCTHSAFRQRGFATAVSQACLHRLAALGLRAAYITGYSLAAIALYGALGPSEPLTSFVHAQPERRGP